MQITPDFFVETDAEGHITMTLNQGNVPDLIVSPDAQEKLKRYEAEKDHISRAEAEDMPARERPADLHKADPHLHQGGQR